MSEAAPPSSETVARRALGLAALFAIALVGAYLRFFELEVRPPHSDEAVNFLFVETTNRMGYFPYSHENYHGPIFFYLITALVNLFGEELTGLRLGAVLSGIATIVLIGGFRRASSWSFVLLAALFVALSPSMLFFSRYAIHESLLVLATLGLGVGLYRWARTHHVAWWYACAVALALMVTTKETFTVAAFCLTASFLALGEWRSHFAAAKGQLVHVFLSYLLFIFLVLLTFSGGFRWVDGIGEMLLAVPQWVGRSSSDTGHFKPFGYYVRSVLWPTEPATLAVPALALFWLAVERALGVVRGEKSESVFAPERKLLLFTGVWSLTSVVVYSLIKYKTVWLIINLTLPLLLFLAAVCSALLGSTTRGYRVLGAIVAGASLLTGLPAMLRYNYLHVPVPGFHAAVDKAAPYGPTNPFSYVHTSPGTLALKDLVIEYWDRKPDAKVLVGVEGYFPLPYYFRNRVNKCAYTKTTDIPKSAQEFDVMILDYYKDRWEHPDWVRKYYRLSDYAEAYVYFRKLGDFPPPDPGPPPTR